MLRLLGYALGFGIMLMGIMLGGELHLFIDYPSMALTIGGGFAFCLAVHAPSAMSDAVRAARGSDPVSLEDFHRHDAVLETLSNTTIASGVAGTLIGMVNMLAHMDDPKHIGPACAVALLTILYAGLVSGLLVMPLRGRLKSRVESPGTTAPKGPSALLPASMVFMVVILLVLVQPNSFG